MFKRCSKYRFLSYSPVVNSCKNQCPEAPEAPFKEPFETVAWGVPREYFGRPR